MHLTPNIKMDGQHIEGARLRRFTAAIRSHLSFGGSSGFIVQQSLNSKSKEEEYPWLETRKRQSTRTRKS